MFKWLFGKKEPIKPTVNDEMIDDVRILNLKSWDDGFYDMIVFNLHFKKVVVKGSYFNGYKSQYVLEVVDGFHCGGTGGAKLGHVMKERKKIIRRKESLGFELIKVEDYDQLLEQSK